MLYDACRLMANIGDWDIGALSPTHVESYQRLGWKLWQGTLP